MAHYFTKDTDKALELFKNSTSDPERHQVFKEKIQPAFEKLIENLIYVYGFFIDDIDTLKRECLANLYEMIPKFKPERGTKGFSYFNVIAKNWFIQKTRERNRRNKIEAELHYDLEHDAVKNDPNFIVTPHEEFLEEKERWIQFYEELESWRDQLTKKTEKQVLEAVIFLMKNPELVSIYNKKAVYLYLRELTGLNTKQVVVNLKKIKGLYSVWNNRYSSTGDNEFAEEDFG
jgi:DNA-directed RNA polymerase specialized sigma24 family protein